MSELTKSRLYIAAFLSIAAATVFACSYYEGRTDEAIRQDDEQNQIVDQALAEREYWQAKYSALSHEADFLTVAEAERKFQEGGR